jgi:hypothetical protein
MENPVNEQICRLMIARIPKKYEKQK